MKQKVFRVLCGILFLASIGILCYFICKLCFTGDKYAPPSVVILALDYLPLLISQLVVYCSADYLLFEPKKTGTKAFLCNIAFVIGAFVLVAHGMHLYLVLRPR